MEEQREPIHDEERRLAQFALEALFSRSEAPTVDESIADVDSASVMKALRIALHELENLDLED